MITNFLNAETYTSVAQAVHQFGLMGFLAAGILTWTRYWRRARVYAGAAKAVYQVLWITLVMSGIGTVWAHYGGDDVMLSFANASIQVVLAMALLPAGVALLRLSGFARAPHLRLYDLERHTPLDLPTRAARRRAILADNGWTREPYAAIGLWTLFIIALSAAYFIGVTWVTSLPDWGEWLGGPPELAPEIEEIFKGQSRQPLLVIGQLLSAGVAEEVLYRMLGLGAVAWLLRRQSGGRDQSALAIVIVSLIFALGHAGWLLQPLWKELHTFGLGLAFGFMVRRYGATASIPAHMALNLVASFEIFFAP